MAMKIITGYTGEKHITPADDAGFIKGIVGEGEYVLPTGSRFAATIQSNNEIRIADGELVMQGRHARNGSAYETVVIANGSQGMYRNDLIVARYTKDASTSVETIALVVIKGTETAGTAADPNHNTGNIDNGETRDFPLYRVKLNGIVIETVERLWQLNAADTRKNIGLVFDCGFITPSEPIAAGAYVDLEIEFNKEFSAAPYVEFFFRSHTTAATFGKCAAAYVPNSGSKTGCTIRIFNSDSSARQPSIEWHAWDPQIVL